MKIFGSTTIKALLFTSTDNMLMIPSAFSIPNMMLCHSLNFSTPNTPTLNLPWKRKQIRCWPFLMSSLTNKDPCSLLTSVHRKKTFSGLLTNFFSFASYSYKIGLIRTLVDRAYKVNNTLVTFNDDVIKRLHIFKMNQYPESLINRVVKSYLNNPQNSNSSASPTDTSTIHFKFPFIYIYSFTQGKVRMLAKKYCKNLKIKLAFSSFKVRNLISVKDCVPRSLRSCVVYKFTCAGM